VKHRPTAPPGFFTTEAAGLAWLAEAGAVRVPRVLAVDATTITLERITPGPPTERGAEDLGRGLAELHAAGAPAFGAPWPGFIGPLPMDNGDGDDWATFYAERRVRPFVRQARDRGAVTRAQAEALDTVLGRLPELVGLSGAEPPSRIHGDLWSGNVVWDGEGHGWLVDPAAHGGHRETDLAMLDLFGLAHLDRVLAAYHEARPLADGWPGRVGLHQLHPLVVHAVLFGPAYGARAAEVARAALR
jgi:fructosamine-3-kinase